MGKTVVKGRQINPKGGRGAGGVCGGAPPGPQGNILTSITCSIFINFCRCVAVSLSLDHSDRETDVCRVWNQVQRSRHFQGRPLPALQLPQENGEWPPPSP